MHRWLLIDFEQVKKISSYFADFEQVKTISSYFAHLFQEVKKIEKASHALKNKTFFCLIFKKSCFVFKGL